MAIYHLEAKMVSRGAGRSAVAAAAYLSCSRMLNEYDGVQHDYPALYASLFSSHSSGSCTRMKRRLPPSSALSCITAWAVVAEPEKKSRICKKKYIFVRPYSVMLYGRFYISSPWDKLSQSWRPRLSISASLRLDLPPTKI